MIVFVCYRKQAESLHRALKAYKVERVKIILMPYGPAVIKAATDIINLMQHTEQLQDSSTHLTPLEAAIRLGDYTICKHLIDEGAMKIPANKHKNLLRHAFEGGHFKVAKLLLEAGASVWMEYEGMLSLCLALNNKHCTEDIVKSIIEAGFPHNEIIHKPHNQTALHVAVLMNHLSIVEYLLSEFKVNPNVKDILGRTPLHYSAEMNYIIMTEMLVIYGAKIDIECNNNFTPLFYMIAHGNLSSVELLLTLGSDIHHESGQKVSLTPLHFASILGQLRTVKILLEKEADVDKQISETGETALHSVARLKVFSKVDSQSKIAIDCIVQMLIKERANLGLRDKFGLTPLQVALKVNNLNLAKVLITNGSPLNDAVENSNGSLIPFHTVAATCNKELISLCLQYGGDCRKPNNEGFNPAQVAMLVKVLHEKDCRSHNCRRSHKDCSDIFKLFLKYRLPFELLVKIQWRAPNPPYPKEISELVSMQQLLNSAVKLNQPKHFKQAIEQGADVKVCSVNMPYPVHFLASKGRCSMLAIFLARGVSVNALDADGKTPLHVAAEAGHYDCCVLLLELGAMYNSTSSKCPKTPKKLAEENKRLQIVNLFKNVEKQFKNMKRGHLSHDFDPCGQFLATLNCCNKKGETLLSTALKYNYTQSANKVIFARNHFSDTSGKYYL